MLAFNADGHDGLLTDKAPGQAPLLSHEYRRAMAAIIDQGPNPAVDCVERWWLKDLAAWLFERFGVSASEQTVSREVRALGYRKLSARPRHHAQAPDAIDYFKKLPMLRDRIAALVASGKPLELWWQDEARFGQKTKIARGWAKRGSRPSAPVY